MSPRRVSREHRTKFRRGARARSLAPLAAGQDGRSADLLYNLISRRHEKRATVISTNLAYKQWGAVFPGAACVGALVDRFAQHCHVIDIDADSWRAKSSLRRKGKAKPGDDED